MQEEVFNNIQVCVCVCQSRGLQAFSQSQAPILSIILHVQVCWFWIGWCVFGGRGFTERRCGWN